MLTTTLAAAAAATMLATNAFALGAARSALSFVPFRNKPRRQFDRALMEADRDQISALARRYDLSPETLKSFDPVMMPATPIVASNAAAPSRTR